MIVRKQSLIFELAGLFDSADCPLIILLHHSSLIRPSAGQRASTAAARPHADGTGCVTEATGARSPRVRLSDVLNLIGAHFLIAWVRREINFTPVRHPVTD